MPRQILSKQNIIQASVNLIESGEEPSFAAVARKLGTKSQALYSYFANQRALSYSIVAWAIKKITSHLQEQIFGQSGISGIVSFAVEFRQVALQHFLLTQFVLKMPRTSAYPEVTAAFQQLKKLLNQLLATEFDDAQSQLLASRCGRDLLIGDIINVGTGWFSDKSISADTSFQELLIANLKLIKQK